MPIHRKEETEADLHPAGFGVYIQVSEGEYKRSLPS
jgi:hypothetical protein